MQRDGVLFLSDGDSRSLGAADPRASLWDDFADPVKALQEALRVRAVALHNFGPDRLPAGEPLTTIHEVFVPIFLYHRYQVEAAAKEVGGVFYAHETNDGTPNGTKRVLASAQIAAMDALLDCLEFETITVPPQIARLLTPRTYGVAGSRETFDLRTSPVFDPVSASEAAAETVLAALLDTARLERLVQQHAEDPALPGATLVLGRTTDQLFDGARTPVAWSVRSLFVDHLMRIAADAANTLPVRAAAEAELQRIRERLVKTDPVQRTLDAEIVRFLDRPAGAAFQFARPAAVPPGSPIGWWDDCWGG
jgi:hypothetical protein